MRKDRAMFKSLFSRRKPAGPNKVETNERIVVSAVCWDVYVDGAHVGVVVKAKYAKNYAAHSASSAGPFLTREDAITYLVDHA